MTKRALLSLVLLAAVLPAQTISHKLIYLVDALSCAASAADGITTAHAIGLGAAESNPLLTVPGSYGGGHGRLSYPRLIGYKAAFCAAPFLIHIGVHKGGERPWADKVSLGVGSAGMTTFTTAAIRNLHVISKQRMLDAEFQPSLIGRVNIAPSRYTIP